MIHDNWSHTKIIFFKYLGEHFKNDLSSRNGISKATVLLVLSGSFIYMEYI